ncbi:MAG TPA: IclR family transcriptional regulator, partial [Paracoccaceae bacterium]
MANDRSSDPNGDRYRAPALDKGLDILELLSEQSDGLTRAEIVKAMGRSPSEIYRMLERLVARDYVARSAGGDRYALSLKLLVLANRYPPVRRLVAQAQPLMDAFARESLQSCHLVLPDCGSAVVVAQASPMDTWEFRVRIGARLDLLGTGSGQTLLACQDEARLAETLSTWGAADLADRIGAIRDHLGTVRQQGYRIGESGQLLGVSDISVPILAPDGDAVAVLTCPFIGRPGQMQSVTIPETLERLR